MDRQSRRIPAGGVPLGQQRQVVLTELLAVPELLIEVVTFVGTIESKEPVLRVVDPLSGRAVFCPVSPQGARNLIKTLTPLAEADHLQGGSNGNAAVHE